VKTQKILCPIGVSRTAAERVPKLSDAISIAESTQVESILPLVTGDAGEGIRFFAPFCYV
jgi:hypothetical protein